MGRILGASLPAVNESCPDVALLREPARRRPLPIRSLALDFALSKDTIGVLMKTIAAWYSWYWYPR
jgi:hypothetical protein